MTNGCVVVCFAFLSLPLSAQTYNTPATPPVPSDAELIVRGFHTTDLVWQLGSEWYVTKFGVSPTPGAVVLRTIYMPEPAMERARQILRGEAWQSTSVSVTSATAARPSTMQRALSAPLVSAAITPMMTATTTDATCVGNPKWRAAMDYYASFTGYEWVSAKCDEVASKYYRQDTSKYVELNFVVWLANQYDTDGTALYDSPGTLCAANIALHRPDGIGEHANAARITYRGYKTVENIVVAVPIGARDYTVAIMLPCVRQPGARIVSVEWLTLTDPQGGDWEK